MQYWYLFKSQKSSYCTYYFLLVQFYPLSVLLLVSFLAICNSLITVSFTSRKNLLIVNPDPDNPGQFDPPFLHLWFFQKWVKPWFFVIFNTITSHTFPENFIEIAQVVQKIWRFSPSVLTILDFLTFPCYKETNKVSI